MRICIIEGCSGKHYCKGYCRRHRNSLNKHGDALFVDKPRKIITCNIEGCIKPVHGLGYCDNHYRSLKRCGNPNHTAWDKERKNCKIEKDGTIKILWENAKRTLRSDGYYYLTFSVNKKQYRILEHVYLWEKENGKKPEHHHIHHVNGVRSDNSLENLQLLTYSEHQRSHAGFVIINDELFKKCTKCKTLKPATTEYFLLRHNVHNDGISPACRECNNIYMKRYYIKTRKK